MTRTQSFGIFRVACAVLTTTLLGLAVLSEKSIVRAETRQDTAALKTVWDGVYNTDQSKRGEGISSGACGTCHGDKLVGSSIGPALLGETFLSSWSGSTAYDLFDKVRTTMPADSPGTLKPQQYVDLLAYIFQINGFPAGSGEIAPDPAGLKLVKITATKP